MNKQEILTNLETVFKSIQELDIKSSMTNTRTILMVLNTLQQVYAAINAEDKADEGHAE